MSEANKETVRRIQAAWNANRTDELDQYFRPDFQAHSNVPGTAPGLAGAKAAHAMVGQSLRDRKSEIVDMIAEGDQVLVRVRVTGTNTAGIPWLGAEPNGQPYDFESWSLYTFTDGKVKEHRGVNDITFALQSGAIKAPVPA